MGFGRKSEWSGGAWLALAVVLGIAGCATDPAPVEDRTAEAPPPRRAALPLLPREDAYRVVKGDTLYSIAFRRGLDYRDVAAWNGIAAPAYKILVGQELRLNPPGTPPRTAAAAATPAAAPPAVAQTDAQTGVTTAPLAANPKNAGLFEDVPNAPASAKPSPPPPPADAPPATATVAHGNEPAPPPVPPAAPPPPPATNAAAQKPAGDAVAANAGGILWRWPSSGKVIGGFVAGDQTRQGLDIGGAAGDPVNAAADGEVVYSGSGLMGYGELIIVKHNASFLSAYGHNRKRLVQEGEKVRAGQQIAEMGSSGASRDSLHFEIRKNGKPVNPLDYLPSR